MQINQESISSRFSRKSEADSEANSEMNEEIFLWYCYWLEGHEI